MDVLDAGQKRLGNPPRGRGGEREARAPPGPENSAKRVVERDAVLPEGRKDEQFNPPKILRFELEPRQQLRLIAAFFERALQRRGVRADQGHEAAHATSPWRTRISPAASSSPLDRTTPRNLTVGPNRATSSTSTASRSPGS